MRWNIEFPQQQKNYEHRKENGERIMTRESAAAAPLMSGGAQNIAMGSNFVLTFDEEKKKFNDFDFS